MNNPQKEAIAVRRFRPVFLVAFNAWMATDPLHNPHALPGPTYMPLARRQRWAQPWEGRPAHAGPHRMTARSARLTRSADQRAASGAALLIAQLAVLAPV